MQEIEDVKSLNGEKKEDIALTNAIGKDFTAYMLMQKYCRKN